jgi:hypothetical protein
MISFFFEGKANPEESKEPLARLFGHLGFGYAIRVNRSTYSSMAHSPCRMTGSRVPSSLMPSISI